MKQQIIITLFIGFFSLVHVQVNAQDWNLQTLDFASNGISHIEQIVFDNNEYPHVLYKKYYTSSYYKCYYAKWTGVAWSIEDVPHFDTYIRASSAKFCLDAQNNPHIVYDDNNSYRTYYVYRATNGNLSYQYLSSGTDYKIISTYFSGTLLKVLMTRDGNYYLASKTTSSFTISTIASTTTGILNNSVLDSDGNIYFTFSSGGDTHFGFWDGNELSTFQIAENANHPSITLDNIGIPHVSYYDTQNKNLMHAKLPLQTLEALKAGKYAVKNNNPAITE